MKQYAVAVMLTKKHADSTDVTLIHSRVKAASSKEEAQGYAIEKALEEKPGFAVATFHVIEFDAGSK
jgi:hypothetical protein